MINCDNVINIRAIRTPKPNQQVPEARPSRIALVSPDLPTNKATSGILRRRQRSWKLGRTCEPRPWPHYNHFSINKELGTCRMQLSLGTSTSVLGWRACDVPISLSCTSHVCFVCLRVLIVINTGHRCTGARVVASWSRVAFVPHSSRRGTAAAGELLDVRWRCSAPTGQFATCLRNVT